MLNLAAKTFHCKLVLPSGESEGSDSAYCHFTLVGVDCECQRRVDERRSIINEQCDSLINEVEVKREFFLSDLEYEERSKCDCLRQLIDASRQQGTSLETLIQYTRDVLAETDPYAFIQVGHFFSFSSVAVFGGG